MNIDEWNDEMLALAQRWAIWKRTSFPRGLAGVNVNGCELVLIDSSIACLVESAIERRPLKPGGADQLSRLLDDLRAALPSIAGEGRAYFEELAEIAEKAIRLSLAAAGG